MGNEEQNCPKCETMKTAVTLLTSEKKEQEKFGRYKIIGRICPLCDYIEMYDKPKKRKYLDHKTLEEFRNIAGICLNVGSGKCLTIVDPHIDGCEKWEGGKKKKKICNTCKYMQEGLKDQITKYTDLQDGCARHIDLIKRDLLELPGSCRNYVVPVGKKKTEQ